MVSDPEQPPVSAQLPGVSVGITLAGKYRIERQLGVGGMGQVFQAKHLALDQYVAIKCLLPSASSSRTLLARFEREARVSVKIRSEHVARTLDVGRLPNGAPYIVMEFLEGADLDHLLAQYGPFAPERTSDLVLQACEALAEAHALGIVHRDLKLANLFLTARADGSECLKILDFGISKLQGEDVALTRTAALIGSPRYMSPEQLTSARDVDPRTDIWALGVVMYLMLSGSAPFSASSLTELVVQISQAPVVPLRTHRAEIPRELAAIVERCLEKSPSGRFASVGQLARALAPFGGQGARDSAARISAVLAEPPGFAADSTQDAFSTTTPEHRQNGADGVTPRLGPGASGTLVVPGVGRLRTGLWLALGLPLAAATAAGLYFGVQAFGRSHASVPSVILEPTPAGAPTAAIAAAEHELQSVPAAGSWSPQPPASSVLNVPTTPESPPSDEVEPHRTTSPKPRSRDPALSSDPAGAETARRAAGLDPSPSAAPDENTIGRESQPHDAVKPLRNVEDLYIDRH